VQKTCTQTKLRPLECLKYYFSCGIIFPVTVLSSFAKSPIYCFSDNLSVITNVSDMLNPIILHPNEPTNNDHDVYLAICKVTWQCAPIQLSFQHIKGHQDKDAKRPLMIVKQLNIKCDCQAKQYTSLSHQSSVTLGNPAIHEAQPHLSIAGKFICCNYG